MTRLHQFTFGVRTGKKNTAFSMHFRTSVVYVLYFITRAKVGELLPNVSSQKIHLQYAKAKEADGK